MARFIYSIDLLSYTWFHADVFNMAPDDNLADQLIILTPLPLHVSVAIVFLVQILIDKSLIFHKNSSKYC